MHNMHCPKKKEAFPPLFRLTFLLFYATILETSSDPKIMIVLKTKKGG